MKDRAEDILKRVRRIEISTRKLVDSALSGQYHTRFRGQGMQFSDFREYYAGDDIRHIDWKVTARTQSAHIKKFEEERDLTVYLMVDISKSGVFSSVSKTKTEALAETCALLAFAAVRNNDRVGLILFSDHVEKHVPPKKGRAHAMRLLTEILYFEPKGKGTDIGAALDFYSNIMRQTAVVILASDFVDTSIGGYEMPLKRVSKKHDVIALRMRDRRDVEVPPVGEMELVDPESGETFTVNTASYSFQKNFKESVREQDKKTDEIFARNGVDRVDLWTHEDYFNRVVQYFRSRGRKR